MRNTILFNRITQVTTNHILSCTYSRWFWISWDAGEITVGTNRDVHVDPFMSAHIATGDEAILINSVGFGVPQANEVEGVPARWAMTETQGMEY